MDLHQHTLWHEWNVCWVNDKFPPEMVTNNNCVKLVLIAGIGQNITTTIGVHNGSDTLHKRITQGVNCSSDLHQCFSSAFLQLWWITLEILMHLIELRMTLFTDYCDIETLPPPHRCPCSDIIWQLGRVSTNAKFNENCSLLTDFYWTICYVLLPNISVLYCILCTTNMTLTLQ